MPKSIKIVLCFILGFNSNINTNIFSKVLSSLLGMCTNTAEKVNKLLTLYIVCNCEKVEELKKKFHRNTKIRIIVTTYSNFFQSKRLRCCQGNSF